MTEADWLAATEPGPMLAHLRDRGGASDRKLRLYAVACGRLAWPHLTDEVYRSAVETAERFADGLAGEPELRAAHDTASLRFYEPFIRESSSQRLSGPDLSAHTRRYIALMASSYRRPMADSLRSQTDAGAMRNWPDEARARGGILRCIFGNPFRRAPALAPAVLAWDGGTVPKLAAAIYEERAFGRLPVLADALEDAGCTDADILGHCRAGGEHVRGCWVVDLMLGKG
jgi:hypothetical protein